MANEEDKEENGMPFNEVTTGQEIPPKKGLLEELDELRANGQTSTARYQEEVNEVEVLRVSQFQLWNSTLRILNIKRFLIG